MTYLDIFTQIFQKIAFSTYTDIVYFGFGFSCLDYSKSTISVNNKIDVSSLLSANSILDNYTEENKNILVSTINLDLEVMTKVKTYTKYVQKFVIFNKYIKIVKDYSQLIYDYEPTTKNNRLFFSKHNKYYNLQVKNIQNNNCNLDFYTCQLMSITAVIFSKDLYNSLKIYFLSIYNLPSQTNNILQQFSVEEFFNKCFKNSNIFISYMPCIQDFRGRIYNKTPLSIIDVKLLRFIIVPNRGTHSPLLKKNKFFNILKEHKQLLKNLFKENLLEENKVILLLAFQCLGKVNKNNLLCDSKIALKELLVEGINLYKAYKNNTLSIKKAEDLAYITSMCFKIDSYVKDKKSFSIIIDSTASGLFHLNLLLDVRDEYLNYFNLSEKTYWYDTYDFLIKKTLESLRKKIIEKQILTKSKKYDYSQITLNDFENYKKYFNRKNLKHVFMTIPYNVTILKALEYFNANIPKDIQKAVTPLFIIFFKEAKFLLNKIYRKKLKDIYKFDLFKNNYKFTFFGKNYDFQYFKFKKKQKEYRINNKRFTTLVYELTNLEDTRKSNTAYIANIIHALDSHFLRSIYETCHERNIYIHTIHDEFIVPVENYFEILEIANSIYSDMFNTLNKNSKKKYSSYFMFI